MVASEISGRSPIASVLTTKKPYIAIDDSNLVKITNSNVQDIDHLKTHTDRNIYDPDLVQTHSRPIS
jgi:hypothetical protein